MHAPCWLPRRFARLAGDPWIALLGLAILAALDASPSFGAVGTVPPASLRVGPPPDWTLPPIATPRPPTSGSPDRIAGGRRQLRVDDQVHLDTAEHFQARSYELLSPQAVESGSEIRATFDPACQSITLHDISIVRDGRRLDRLDTNRIRVLLEEKDQLNHVYRGDATVLVVLDDVRVGDRIDYAFTLRGQNPVFGGRYLDAFYRRWSLPVAAQRLRLLIPEGRRIHLRQRGLETPARVTPGPGFEEWVWEDHDLEAATVESRVPDWYPSPPWVQFSEFATWADVVAWALPLYAVDPPLAPDLEAVAEEALRLEDDEARAVAILTAVQEKVRYLSEALGPRSHAPAAPADVWNRRAGDCKDKVRLFCALARRLGLRAEPVLVSSGETRGVREWWPSPLAFDHVIARVWVQGQPWLVDPTQLHQRGGLAHRYVDPYHAGLVIAPGETDLTDLPEQRSAWPDSLVIDRFTVGRIDEPAELEVTTVARGAEAERLRATLAETAEEELGRNFLRYYADTYPGIELVAPPEWHEDKDGSLTSVERYRIPEFWRREDGRGPYKAYFHPTGLQDLGEDTDLADRTQPLEIAHPRRQVVRTEVRLPEDWPWLDESPVIDGPAYRLEIAHRYTNQVGVREYRFHTKTDFVAPQDLGRHAEAEKEIRDSLGFELTWPAEGFRPNWPMLALAPFYTLGLIAGVAVLHRFWATRPRANAPLHATAAAIDTLTDGRPPLLASAPTAEPATDSPASATRGPVGLRGWLWLVGIGLIFRPLAIAYGLLDYAHVFDADGWQALNDPGTDDYHVLLAPLSLVEVLLHLALIVTGLWLWFLFFGKRRVFPIVLIAWLLTFAVFATADQLIASLIPSVIEDREYYLSAWRDIIKAWVACAIWIPYLRRSRRVKNTFVK